jgi:hypothetical protein
MLLFSEVTFPEGRQVGDIFPSRFTTCIGNGDIAENAEHSFINYVYSPGAFSFVPDRNRETNGTTKLARIFRYVDSELSMTEEISALQSMKNRTTETDKAISQLGL